MIAVIILVIIDRITKLWVSGDNVSITIIPKILKFTYTENRGMVFGVAQGSNYLMAIISLIICIAILIYIIKARRDEGFCYAWYFILAGGIGNLIDRFYYGYVIDFIDTPFIATFNLADAFIVFGIFVLIIHLLFDRNKKTVNTRREDRFNW